jgi:hypothetical protein
VVVVGVRFGVGVLFRVVLVLVLVLVLVAVKKGLFRGMMGGVGVGVVEMRMGGELRVAAVVVEIEGPVISMPGITVVVFCLAMWVSWLVVTAGFVQVDTGGGWWCVSGA